MVWWLDDDDDDDQNKWGIEKYLSFSEDFLGITGSECEKVIALKIKVKINGV